MLIDGDELAELKRHTMDMAEAYGLDGRVERYHGIRPIGFYRWDLDCLIAVVESALTDRRAYPSTDSQGYQALQRLLTRFQDEYRRAYG